MSIIYQKNQERLRLFTSENNNFAAHLHKQIELIVVLEGNLTLTVDHAVKELSPGTHAIVFPNQLHSLRTAANSKILLCIFDEDFCHNYRQYFHNSIPARNEFAVSNLSEHSKTAVDGLLLLIGTFPRGQQIPARTRALAEGYLTLLLADMFSRMEFLPRTVSGDLELEQKLLIYLEKHYMEDLSLEILSRKFGVSRFTLSRLFTDKLHTTFPYYVNSKRLEYACKLLVSTDLSVTQIALDAGFGSSRTFFREFRQAYHSTPREYRRQHRL